MESNIACREACNHCAAACNFCASSCLLEPDPKAMARCISLDIDCANVCLAAAGFIARESEFSNLVCGTCAKVCMACAAECARHPMPHCQKCAEACRFCAQVCHDMARH